MQNNPAATIQKAQSTRLKVQDIDVINSIEDLELDDIETKKKEFYVNSHE